MATTSAQRGSLPAHVHRHHPYASGSRPGPTMSSTTKHSPASVPRSMPVEELNAPPSPPRSRRDHSETPPLGLGVAFGGASGGKWWDEELPAPPASLTSILDSFRRSGEGDRELLLSILGAKKAEEERLTALIQTRLTVLQARLQLHSAAAQLNSTMPPEFPPAAQVPMPMVAGPSSHHMAVPSLSIPGNGAARSVSPSYTGARTPSLQSRGSASETSSQGAVSPTLEAPPPSFLNHARSTPMNKKEELDRYSLGATPATAQSFWRRGNNNNDDDATLPPIRERYDAQPIATKERAATTKDSSVRSGAPAHARSVGSVSPRSGSERNGLDMLLDAGRRVEV